MIVWDTLRLVGAGIAAGIVVSLWSGQFIASLLYGVAPGDPLIVGAAALILSVVGTIAAWLPAHRASLSDPAIVLRQTT
jgi:ABC-type antimicrobial peptide transport system permease subunit